MKGSRDILFPTPLYTTTFPDMEKLNKGIKAAMVLVK